jgi:hypothetical protein
MFIRSLPTAIVAAGVFVGLANPSVASSHREAPFVTENPKVDGADFYLFNNYEEGREDFVTIIANYLPLQDPYGGPNYFFLDPDAIYEIHIDNNGDAREDITFRFQFTNELKDIKLNIGGAMVSVPLVNIGSFAADSTGPLNIIEKYTLTVLHNGGGAAPVVNASGGGTTFIKPADNIGNKSIPDYAAYAAAHIYDIIIPGCAEIGRVFVGQRKDPFVVNLGETFDLVNTNPLGPVDGEQDDLADKNVTSFILEVPKSCLTANGESVIGAWTTASLQQNRKLNRKPTFNAPTSESGQWVQVSRLGMPLVNEVIIGLKDKNKFNASEPRDDGQFLTYVTNPTLPALLNVLFGVTPPCLPRNDLVTVFLTGVPGLNQPANVTPSEMLRLNTSTPAASKGSQNNLGVLGGDLAGFPNGRRPGDDAVDIELRVVMGALYPDAGDPNGCAPQGDLAFTDGAIVNDSFFDDTFPYLRTPIPGSPN